MKNNRSQSSRRAFAAGGLTALATLGLSRLSIVQAAGAAQASGGAQTAAPGAQAAVSGKAVSPAVEQTNVAVVTEFCTAFARKDVAKAVSLLGDTCTYRVVQNRPPIVGKEKVTEQITGLIERGAEFKIHKTVALGPLVMNDRDDVLVRQTGGTITIRLTGFFFVEDGKISEWTDYVVR